MVADFSGLEGDYWFGGHWQTTAGFMTTILPWLSA